MSHARYFPPSPMEPKRLAIAIVLASCLRGLALTYPHSDELASALSKLTDTPPERRDTQALFDAPQGPYLAFSGHVDKYPWRVLLLLPA